MRYALCVATAHSAQRTAHSAQRTYGVGAVHTGRYSHFTRGNV
jgi:hypothetical protein